MGGHGHGEPYKVPDASMYKVENVPKLVEVREALARQGLRDPWLRNEVWRYDAKQFGTHATRLRAFMLRGFVWGLGLTAITVACEAALGGDDHHGHGHGEHGGH
ncbi:NADH dehydrogenase [ubiquinone] 1 beta subcomplex subunit 3 [Stomoxys calcitrans]|uniref:NADH dehydrogenase [ubiquinone] 1 beta subcomplex subunit 3 n=1 Tax=Stomoxys calcitrans TaxID=35570 RepID=UPI0027E2C59B|nr:NADH dehydrogenase [ubiquinone] 1 beta subcomplex subunit 3 [Stomoxys calcitrans]XP_013118232.2 NADH dehydrogenase [ubiquinone] 1 beta subcomplex subunit 3 [Stomoxys calcitrans]XP_059225774.1 NADH dehydrogenase [ubiquinone] 1 beta subcomplex subunit 3 [Stomoxys calcitrans]